MNLEHPAQIMSPAAFAAAKTHDYASGTLEEPRALYLDASGATVLGPALIVEPWPLEEQLSESRMARAQIRGDEHHRETCGKAPWSLTERDSCGTCALLGWGSHNEQHGTPAPNYAGWARVYVQAREPVPRQWFAAFVAELNDTNENYRDCLRRDVATYGFRLTDERPGYRLRRPNAESVLAWARDYYGDDDPAGYLRGRLEDRDDYDAATWQALEKATA